MAKSKETRSKIDFNNPPKGKVYVPIPAYSGETAQPFQRNGMLFRFKRHKAC